MLGLPLLIMLSLPRHFALGHANRLIFYSHQSLVQ